MKRVGRNSPCPCNSGKKYKKCHGLASIIEMSPEPYNYELRKLQKGLSDFALKTYAKELDSSLRQYTWPSEEIEKEKQDQFILGLTAWFIVQKQLEQGQTIVSIYEQKEKSKVKQARVKNKLKAWTKTSPSIYQVEKITESSVRLRDILSDKVHDITNVKQRKVQENDYLLGVLLPYIQSHEPFLTMIPVLNNKERFIEKMKHIEKIEFIRQYPELLLEQIDPAQRDEKKSLEWEKPIYESVSVLFKEKMEQKQGNETLIKNGVDIWHTFAHLDQPNFQKPGGFAAALEYMVYDLLVPSDRPTQTNLATRYDISPNTVKRNIEKLYQSYQENKEYEEFIIEDKAFENEAVLS